MSSLAYAPFISGGLIRVLAEMQNTNLQQHPPPQVLIIICQVCDVIVLFSSHSLQ